MTYNEALELITRSVEQKCISSIIDYYNWHSCSSDQTGNNIRCCNIARLILMDKIFDCDIRRIFNYFYSKSGSQYENNKLFSYNLNCYPQCPTVEFEDICRDSS
jgi:hypothetical protein